MSTLYIAEFAAFGRDIKGYPGWVAQQATLAEQTVTLSGTSAPSAAFNTKTRLVRVHCDVACSIKFGSGTPTAATTDARMSANQTEYFFIDGAGHAVSPMKVAGILN